MWGIDIDRLAGGKFVEGWCRFDKLSMMQRALSLGLVNASILSMALLTTGATLIATAFLLQFIYSQYPFLSIFLVAIPIAGFFVLKQFRKFYSLSKEYIASDSSNLIGEKILNLSARNPQWIMVITQTYCVISIILLLSKFLL